MHRIKKHPDERPPLPITARRLAEHVNKNILPGFIAHLVHSTEVELSGCGDPNRRAELEGTLKFLRTRTSIKPRTAARWLNHLGFKWNRIARRGMYVDGHEREDVVKYRQADFIPKVLLYKRRAEIHLYDPTSGTWHDTSVNLRPGQKRIVFVNQDETLFYSADALRGVWEEASKPQIRAKSKGDRYVVRCEV